MKFKPTTWLLLSIALFIAACLFWRLGDQYQQRHNAPQNEKPTPRSERSSPRVANSKKPTASAPAVVFPENLIVSGTATNLIHPASPTDYRVTNTKLSFEELAVKPSAVLLRNAWIDTSAKQALNIPAELRATADPGSYIIQSRDVITPAFRKLLSEAGASVVSYIPNNAYLVTVSGNGAQQLAHSPQVQSVLPFEPFYKVDMDLMPEALGQRENYPPVRATLYEGQKEAALAAVKQFGGTVVGEDKTPFGPQLIISAPPSAMIVQKLAQLSAVQGIEKYQARVLMNDLSRQRVGVSVDTVTNANYLGLSGLNVLVNVNDTGADSSHPDLLNRVFGVTNDPVGHGTHVVGTILSSGLNGPSGSVLTNFGSVSNANFRGMAPNASVFVLPFNADFSDNLNTFSSDAALAETAARTNLFIFGKTNTLISNNSWGYGSSSYNSSAAIFDGAARDALPDVPGSQPILFIFAAGNRGGGSDVCFSADRADTVSSPATMKNGLAVGAIENLRNIGTNIINQPGLADFGPDFHIAYTCDNCTIFTNDTLFLGQTDSSNQVVGFSSKGNTGINSKGMGRFKPDLVAPGSFVVSTRPVGANWDEASYYSPTNRIGGYGFADLVIKGNETNSFRSVIVPDNTVELRISAIATTPLGAPLLIFAGNSPSPSTDPDAVSSTNSLIIPNPSTNCIGDRWFVEVVNPTNTEAVYNLDVGVWVTNKGNVLTTLSNLNSALDPNGLYRFESGTSMAAPAVSGVAALLQEFFEQRLNRSPSPALMKALLINGARSVSSSYHLQTDPQLNQQGWGLVNIQNSIPAIMDAVTGDEASWPLRFFDQDSTNALATGQSHTYNLSVSNSLASITPLRITLVWTDPPGNPAASINLVNDLDLIVTNNDTGDVYYGNNFSGTGDFSDVNLVTSNGVAVSWTGVTNDILNNVENVYINAPLTGTNYSITVMAKRVNVNAVIANTNDIVQDYALVVSSGNISNAFSITPAVLNVDTNPLVTFLDIGPVDSTNSITTNASRSIVLEGEHVGANSSLLVSTNGTNIQWRFYAVTNATTFTNAIFSIFSAPTLAIARNISDPYAVSQVLGPNSQLPLGRNIEADLDLFVSTNSALTNLDDVVVGQSWKSVDRLSDEMIVLTNSVPGTVYYIGVKSEDQQGGEFSLGIEFTEKNPLLANPDGSFSLEFSSADIPDGSPSSPKAALIPPRPGPAQKFPIAAVVVQDQFTHGNFGDLTGLVSHSANNRRVFLNNHNRFLQGQENGTVSNTYDDIDYLTNPPPDITITDGPGNLGDFIGDNANGSWRYVMIDSSPDFGGGHLDGAVITLYPQVTNGFLGATSGELFSGTVATGQTRYGSLIIPATAVSLTLRVSIPNAGEGPLEMYVRRDDGSAPRLPGASNYDYSKTIFFPGDSLTIGRGDVPPLMAGTYIIAIHNAVAPTTSFDVFFDMTLDLGGTAPTKVVSTNLVVTADQVFTNSYVSTINLNLPTNQIVSDVRVGVRIDHPRVSDLVLHLVSPEGTSVLLSENRGHLSTNGFGLGNKPGEFAYTSFSEDPDVATIPIKFASSSNFLEFIQPTLIATNTLEDTLALTPVTLKQAAGDATEDRKTVDTGTTNGTIVIRYQMYTQADDLRVYYEGNLIYDSGLVSGSNNVNVSYSGTFSTSLEIVMNEGGNPSPTAWDYSVSFLKKATNNADQFGTGVAILGNDLYLSGSTLANETNGIAVRLGLPMQDNAFPIWDLNYPGEPGTNRFNGVAVTSEGVYMVGGSMSLTDDNMTDGLKQSKGVVVKFPLSAPATTNDIYGSMWHLQTPDFPGAFANSGFEELYAITATVEGSNDVLYVTGNAQANSTNLGRMILAKVSPFGTNIWATNDASVAVTTNYSCGRAITTLNGNIYVAGGNADSGATNAYLVKYDLNGNALWSRVSTYTGEFKGIAAYGDNIYTVGFVKTGAGVSNCVVQKWDESGTSIWTNQIVVNGTEDILNAVIGYADRLYAAGSTLVGGVQRDALLLELNQATGALVTNATYTGITTYDGGAQGDDVARSIASDGFDIYLVGDTHHWVNTNRTDSDVLVLRYRIKDDYLAEEPLSLFTGEHANSIINGNNTNGWRLTIWDNRADAALSPGKLLSWQLQLTLAPTNDTADTLIHDVPFTGVVSPSHTNRYFIVNVPYTASKATITLTNLSSTTDGLNLWFKQDGLPVPPRTFANGDYLLLSSVPEGTATLTTSGFPQLLPGQRFYLAVEFAGNTDPEEFAIQVSFDNTATTFMEANSSASGSLGSGGSTANNLYQFRIDPNSPTTIFQLQNLTGNVEVFLKRGSLPSSGSYDFHQTLTGTNFGQIVIQPNGSMPDVSGSWFASVGKLSTGTVTYDVVITNLNQSPIFGSFGDQFVAKGDLLSFAVPATDPDAGQQLTFSLDAGAPAGASIDPSTGVFSWVAQGPSTNAVTFRVTDDGNPPLSATKTINIIVTEKLPVLETPTMVSGQLQITWSSVAGQKYEVQTSTNLVDWTKVSTNSATGTSMTYLDPQPTAGQVDKFYRVHLIP